MCQWFRHDAMVPAPLRCAEFSIPKKLHSTIVGWCGPMRFRGLASGPAIRRRTSSRGSTVTRRLLPAGFAVMAAVVDSPLAPMVCVL
jgi:hypothetical protein